MHGITGDQNNYIMMYGCHPLLITCMVYNQDMNKTLLILSSRTVAGLIDHHGSYLDIYNSVGDPSVLHSHVSVFLVERVHRACVHTLSAAQDSNQLDSDQPVCC